MEAGHSEHGPVGYTVQAAQSPLPQGKNQREPCHHKATRRTLTPSSWLRTTMKVSPQRQPDHRGQCSQINHRREGKRTLTPSSWLRYSSTSSSLMRASSGTSM